MGNTKMTTKELKIQLALGSLSFNMKCKLAKNPNTPKRILTLLSKDENWWIRSYVVENSNISRKILIELSKDDIRYVKSKVAENPNTPVEVLIKLSNDEDWGVRHMALRRLI